MIPGEEYSRIIGLLPILCVDIVLRNSAGEYLLVRRVNEPRKGEWWVPGGRVLKGETLERAARRKIGEELSLQVKRLTPVGYYEAVSQRHPFELVQSLHAVSVVFTGEVHRAAGIRLDSQSDDWKFATDLPYDFKIEVFRASCCP